MASEQASRHAATAAGVCASASASPARASLRSASSTAKISAWTDSIRARVASSDSRMARRCHGPGVRTTGPRAGWAPPR